MADVTLDEIEEGIKSLIKAAAGMQYLKSVATYGGELDDDLKKVLRSYPAVWIVYAGSGKPKKVAAGKWKTTATFVLMVAARNVKNEASTRKGSSGEVGSYQIIQDAGALLLNQDLGLEIARFEPGAIRTLYNTKIGADGLSVLSQQWTTAYMQHAPTEDDVALVGMNIKYYLKPGDDVEDLTQVLELNVE